MGFEPTRAEHIGLAVQRLNHSATSSLMWCENTCMTTVRTNWNNWNPLQRNKFWNSESPIDYVTEILEDKLRTGITQHREKAWVYIFFFFFFFFLLFLFVV